MDGAHSKLTPIFLIAWFYLRGAAMLTSLRASDLHQLTSPERHPGARSGGMILTIDPGHPPTSSSSLQPFPTPWP